MVYPVSEARTVREGGTSDSTRILRGVQAAKNARELYATAANVYGEPGPLSVEKHFRNMELAIWNERPGEKVRLGGFDSATGTLVAPIEFPARNSVHEGPQIQVLRICDVKAMGLGEGVELGLQRILEDGRVSTTITVFTIGPDSDALHSPS
jgi:hypothetical protein